MELPIDLSYLFFVDFKYSREIFNTQWLQFCYRALCVMHILMIAYKMMNSAQQFVRAESKTSEFMYGGACSILKSIDFLMVIASKDRPYIQAHCE